MMAFVVDGHVRAISVELIGRLHGDFRARSDGYIGIIEE